jgi:transposase-like protein
VQLCVVHLVRVAALRIQGTLEPDHQSPARALHRAATIEAAEQRFDELEQAWGGRYPAIIRLWRSAWEQFTPFLAFPPEIRRMVYTTNAVEPLNARFRQATRRRGHFPNERAALKVLYLVIRSPRPNRTNVTGKIGGWK